eukprot:4255945-Alexandrium_andersonii.AAC.1
MVNFEEMHERMQALATFFHHAWTREAFVACCLDNTPYACYVEDFNTFSPTLVGWRWGSVTAVIEELLALEVPIRQAWNERAMTRRAEVVAPGRSTRKLTAASEA